MSLGAVRGLRGGCGACGQSLGVGSVLPCSTEALGGIHTGRDCSLPKELDQRLSLGEETPCRVHFDECRALEVGVSLGYLRLTGAAPRQ